MNDGRPKLAITMGDPAGIGAEIIVKALQQKRFYEESRPLVIGNAPFMEESLAFASLPMKVNPVNRPEEAIFRHKTIDVLHVESPGRQDIAYGRTSSSAGRWAFSFIDKAIDLALNRQVDGVVTAPINKTSLHLAGYTRYAGHTEIFADKTGTRDYSMLLAVDDLYVLHVSTHVSLREACDLATQERVFKVMELAQNFIDTYRIKNRTIAVCALNPHAGEGGAFGREEMEEIIPAIEKGRKQGMDVAGPLPPDTVFVQARKGRFQVMVAMYHDQGHIPVKIINFEEGVNVTVGIPIIRTSVDHGTAFGKAGRGTADPRSMEAALRMGISMARAKFYPEGKESP